MFLVLGDLEEGVHDARRRVYDSVLTLDMEKLAAGKGKRTAARDLLRSQEGR